jgi:putative multiple sugar transport system permease protein
MASITKTTSFGQNVRKVLSQNIREYGMYIALFVIMVIFDIASKGLFLSARNISDLINQTGYIAVLAVGMTLVIVIRHIDLSVGYLSGFLGAVAAIAMASWGLPWLPAIFIVMIVGVLAGLLSGFLVAQMKIPAFVATLAAWLGFHGALQLVTAGTGTIIISDKTFNAIGNGFIPDIFSGIGILPTYHKTTLLLGVIVIVLFIVSAINGRKKKQAYNFEVLPQNIFILELVFITALVGAITWIMAGYRGLSWTAVVVIVVVLIYNFITSQTVLGRHIYAVGGNPEAAELSGISVKRITYMVFGSMGMLAALSGVLFASRLQSATTTAGNGFELDAIAAAYVGGVSAAGGVGKIIGSIIGALVMASLTNGMNLLGIDISLQLIVRALVLVAAVIFDVITRNRAR